jgi:hypothetical protein
MRRLTLILAVGAICAGGPSGAAADPIPEKPSPNQIPEFVGRAATPQPLSLVDAPTPPRHPHMAPNDRSNLHDDAYQTDTANWQGPLGRDTQRLSFSNAGVCGSITFDSKDRLVTVCVGAVRPVLKLLDPGSLKELASMDLPPRQSVPANLFQDFTGGGYFYLDHRDRAIIPTTTRHIFVVGQTAAPGFRIERDYDVSGSLASDDKVISALPDWSGRIWFATIRGIVGAVDPAGGAVKVYDTKEPIGNSHAVDETGGVYIVTDGALYRFDADAAGAPKVTWRQPYSNTGEVKPGQTEKGSGTTPTLMGRDYVSITDNADPMNVVVYRRAQRLSRGRRLVCEHPVFRRGAGATDNSLIGAGRSMIVENNYGYAPPPEATEMGRTTAPGIERVDIDRDGRGCHTVWKSPEISPSTVPKLSLANGLVYAYTKPPGTPDAWYLTALDFHTGRTVWRRLTGTGLFFNVHYAGLAISPRGVLYTGVLGGTVAVADR